MMWLQIFGSLALAALIGGVFLVRRRGDRGSAAALPLLLGVAADGGGLVARIQEAPQIAAMTIFAIGAILGAGLAARKETTNGASFSHDLTLAVTTFTLSIGTLAIGLLGLRGAAIALVLSAIAIAAEFVTDHDGAPRRKGAATSELVAVYDPDKIAIGDIVELVGIPPAAVRKMDPQGVGRERSGQRHVIVRVEVALPPSAELLTGLNRASVVAGVMRIDLARR